MNRRTRPKSTAVAAFAMLLLLIFSSPQALVSAVSGAAGTQQQQPVAPVPHTAESFIDHGIALMSTGDRVTLDWLEKQTGGNTSTAAFDKVIVSNFVPLDAKRLLLDIGWQNFTMGQVPNQQWVANWLNASDNFGIQNLIFVGQLSSEGYGSPWIKSLIKADPAAQTYFPNGTAAQYVSVDNPDVAKALEVDLYLLFTYYGGYPTWVGLGTGYPQSDPYYPNGTEPNSAGVATLPLLGYSNSSLLAFADSQYFAQDTNQSGFYGSGTNPGDLLQASFKAVQPSILLNSGVWMTSSGYPVEGNPNTGERVAMRVALPKTKGPFTVSWYGNAVGTPGSMSISLVPDQGGTYSLSNAVETAVLPATGVSSTAGWQAKIQFPGNLTAGSYWFVFSSQSSNQANYYSMYLRDYQVGNELAYALNGTNKELSYSVLWVRNTNGSDLAVYPFENSYIPHPQQSFVAKSVFQFNQVFLFLSDRHFSTVNGTLLVTDVTSGQLVAGGVMSQALTHGLQNWTPIQLNQTVTTVSGDNYTLTVTEPNGGYSWSVVLRGLTVSPAEVGFQGQQNFWLFRLGLMTWAQTHYDYDVITSNGADSVRSGYEDAIRLAPTSNETLQSFEVLMYSEQGGVNYTGGSLNVAFWTSNSNGTAPLAPITNYTIPASDVPINGWLSLDRLDIKVSAGADDWVVFSTSSTQGFSLARLTSPYASFVQVSKDGGKTWLLPAEGPSEYSYRAVLTDEVLGPAISGIPQVRLGAGVGEFAQPIQVSSPAQVKGVYLGIITRQSSATPNNYVQVSISEDDGSGRPSQQALASGALYGDNMTFESPDLAQFTTVARLSPGERYWLVLKAVGGDYNIYPVVYLSKPGNSTANALVSGDAGFTWGAYSSQTTTLSYGLASPTAPNPTFDTKELSSDLAKFHNFPTNSLPLKGWNAYVQMAQATMMNQVAAWLQQNTSRNFEFVASVQPTIISASGAGALSPLPVVDPFSDCSSLQSYLLKTVPLTNEQFYSAGDLNLLDSCKGSLVSNYAQFLNEIPYLPDGQSAPANATSGSGGISANSTTPTVTPLSSPTWSTGNGSTASPDVYYSVSGGFLGPLVVWVSNVGGSAEKASISLDLSSYGINGSWVAVNLSNLQSQTGTSANATLNLTVPPLSWEPVMVSQYLGNFAVQYSDATVLRQFPYPNQGLYYFQAPLNHTVLVAISSNSSLQSVVLDSSKNLPEVSTSALYAGQPGWNYTKGSSTLLVSFVSTGDNSFRVLSYVPPPAPPPVFPLKTIVEALIAFVAVDVVIAAYFRFARRRKRST